MCIIALWHVQLIETGKWLWFSLAADATPLSQFEEKENSRRENKMDSDLSRFSVIVEDQFSIEGSKGAGGGSPFVCVHSE